MKHTVLAIGMIVALSAGRMQGDKTVEKSDKQPAGERHIYKEVDTRELSLYVVKPDDWNAGDSRPAVVFFFGGGWIGGGPTQFNEHCTYLASRGMVCIQVEYRLLNSKSSEPPVNCIRDAKSAMRWVRAKATELGIDPHRIASGGGSAGGHLAAFVGMMDGIDDPQDDLTVSARSNAMLLFNPVFDNGPTGWAYKRVGEDYPKYSPFHNITSDDPPAIVFLGEKDNLIPVKTVATFKHRMNAAGVACEALIFEGMPHGFFNYGRSDNIPYFKTMLACDTFLAGLGWVKGEPNLDVGSADLESIRSTRIEASSPSTTTEAGK